MTSTSHERKDQLVAQMLAGDRRAFGAIHDFLYPEFRCHLRARGYDAAASGELMTATFLVIPEVLIPKFRDGGRFPGGFVGLRRYLFTVLRNFRTRRYREGQREAQLRQNLHAVLTVSSPFASDFERIDQHLDLAEALAALKADERELVLDRLRGYSLRELAPRYGWSHANARRRWCQIRDRLTEALGCEPAPRVTRQAERRAPWQGHAWAESVDSLLERVFAEPGDDEKV